MKHVHLLHKLFSYKTTGFGFHTLFCLVKLGCFYVKLQAFKYNVDLPAERHRTPKVCPSARKRIEPRSQLGDTTQRHRQLVGAAQEGNLTEFEEDQQFEDLADQVLLPK